jgi:hypothetical protein
MLKFRNLKNNLLTTKDKSALNSKHFKRKTNSLVINKKRMVKTNSQQLGETMRELSFRMFR